MTLARLIVVLLLGAFAVSGGKAQDQPKGIALVLSGGGARGLAQIGTLRTLERNGIVPDYVVGTSIGAIVGGLYSAGYTPNELDSIMRSVPWDDVLSISDVYCRSPTTPAVKSSTSTKKSTTIDRCSPFAFVAPNS